MSNIVVKAIHNDGDLAELTERISGLFGRERTELEDDELEVLMTLVEAYENKHYPIGPILPHLYIQERLDQLGLTRKALIEALGSSSLTSQILTGKRKLTLDLIRKIAPVIKVRAEDLITPTPEEAEQKLKQAIQASVLEPKADRALELLLSYVSQPRLVFYFLGQAYLRLLSRDITAKGNEGEVIVSCNSSAGAFTIISCFDLLVFSLGRDELSTKADTFTNQQREAG